MLPTTEVVGFPPQWGFGPRLGNSQAGCTTSHGPMVRRRPLLQRGAVGGLAHTVLGTRSVPMCSKIVPRFSNALIAGEPRGRHLGSEQGISHPPSGGAVPDVSCFDGQVRNVPPVTDGSGIRRRLPRSGPGYCGLSTASVLEAVDCINQDNAMLSNNYESVGKPPLTIPAVAQHPVGFLPVLRNLRFLMGERDASRLVNVPRTRSVLVCERIAERFVNAVIVSFPCESAGLQSNAVYRGLCADNWQLTRCLPRREPKPKQ